MRNPKAVLGVIGVVLAILYCGRLLYYFLDLSGSVEEARTIGLGPTVLGLGVVGLLFCIWLIVKIVRISAGPRSPGSGRRDGTGATTDDDNGGFDADAVIARYKASQATGPSHATGSSSAGRSVEAAPGSLAGRPAHGGGPARRPSFGKRS